MNIIKVYRDKHCLVFEGEDKGFYGNRTFCGEELHTWKSYITEYSGDDYPEDYLKDPFHCEDCLEKAKELGFEFEQYDPEEELDKAEEILSNFYYGDIGKTQLLKAIKYIRNAKESL